MDHRERRTAPHFSGYGKEFDMKSKIILAAASLLATALLVPTAVLLPRRVAAARPASSAAAAAEGYIVKDYGGKVAVFRDSGGAPQQVLDVYTETLPPQAQEELKKGIRVANSSELLSLIENYTS